MSLRERVASLWPALDNHRRRRAEVRAREDLAYLPDGHAKHRLDLYLPRGDGPFPLVVFLHGGLWNTQDRKLLRFLTGLYANVGVALACAGFAVAIPSFRQDAPAHTEQDVLAAIAWLRAQSRAHELDAESLTLVGHSAGGALAHTLADDLERRAGVVRAVASLNAVYDLPRLVEASPPSFQAKAARYFVDAAAMEPFSPEHRARAASVPALLVTSTGDDAALQAQHAQYLRTAQAAGARCASLSVADVGHMGLVIEFGRTRDRVTGALTRFFAARCVDAALSEGADVVALLAAVMKPKDRKSTRLNSSHSSVSRMPSSA